MKKLMFAAALFAAGAAMAVESQIVGYNNTEIRLGLSAVSAAFDGINATGEIDIQDIVPQNEAMESGVFTITVITDAGDPEMQYIFYLSADTPDANPKDGWYDESGARAVKTFAPGEGFLLNGDLEDSAFQTAGQVAVADTIYSLRTGLNSCGNATPSPITMVDITVGVAVDDQGNFISPNPTTDEEMQSGVFTITRITDAGDPEMQYIYYLSADTPDTNPKDGWYDESGARVDDYPFAAGEGFLINSDMTESYIKIPSAL